MAYAATDVITAETGISWVSGAWVRFGRDWSVASRMHAVFQIRKL